MHTFKLSKDKRTATILFISGGSMMETDIISEEMIVASTGGIAFVVPVDVLAANYVSRLNGGPGFKIGVRDAKRIYPCPDCGEFRGHKLDCPGEK